MQGGSPPADQAISPLGPGSGRPSLLVMAHHGTSLGHVLVMVDQPPYIPPTAAPSCWWGPVDRWLLTHTSPRLLTHTSCPPTPLPQVVVMVHPLHCWTPRTLAQSVVGADWPHHSWSYQPEPRPTARPLSRTSSSHSCRGWCHKLALLHRGERKSSPGVCGGKRKQGVRVDEVGAAEVGDAGGWLGVSGRLRGRVKKGG